MNQVPPQPQSSFYYRSPPPVQPQPLYSSVNSQFGSQSFCQPYYSMSQTSQNMPMNQSYGTFGH